jgi:hypothetical protein
VGEVGGGLQRGAPSGMNSAFSGCCEALEGVLEQVEKWGWQNAETGSREDQHLGLTCCHTAVDEGG